MASPSVTYTFSNSTVADATQVNQNFTDIINGVTDGTKDLSISALTAAGNVNFNGNTTIGNSSGDDLTITASLASSVAIKTTNTYDIGTSSLGLRAIYFGANSQTVNIKGSASMSATWTFTLPVSAGTSTYVLQTDGSGVGSWVSKTVLSVTSKTTTYAATSSDDVILCSTAGGAWSLSLPAAASNTGKVYRVVKTTSDFTALTIDPNSTETINGSATTTLNTQYETLVFISDGSNWVVLEREIPTLVTSYTPTITGAGTVSGNTAKWARFGDFIEIKGDFTAGTPTAVALKIDLPSGLSLDSGKLLTTKANFLGLAVCSTSGSRTLAGTGAGPHLIIDDLGTSATGVYYAQAIINSSPLTPVLGNALLSSGDRITYTFRAPVSGWNS